MGLKLRTICQWDVESIFHLNVWASPLGPLRCCLSDPEKGRGRSLGRGNPDPSQGSRSPAPAAGKDWGAFGTQLSPWTSPFSRAISWTHPTGSWMPASSNVPIPSSLQWRTHRAQVPQSSHLPLTGYELGWVTGHLQTSVSLLSTAS